MPVYFRIAVLLLALVCASAFAADNPPGDVHAGGMMCFSIRPPDQPTQPETKHSAALYRSCDQLYAAKGAACTATTGSMNPPYACDSTGYDPASTLCRCCAVGK
jgi:hypothetical protein